MTQIERYDFLKEWGATPRKMIKAGKGGYVNYGNRKIRVADIEYQRAEPSAIVFQEGREWYRLDLTPHWERGDDSPIKFNHEGACTLAKAVLKQAADDLTEYYKGDFSSIEYVKPEGEKQSETTRRYYAYCRQKTKECEELLGSVISKFCMIRAYWEQGIDIFDIADRMNENPEHITNVIHRLGLDRTNEGEDLVD